MDLSTARAAPGPADHEEVEQAGPPPDDLLFEAPWEQPAPGGPAWAGKAADLAASPSGPLEHAGDGSLWRPNGAVVLAVGGPYFHDGKVAEGRYERDLEPTLLGALGAVQTLARAIFTEVGAPPEAEMSARCERWALLFGPEQGQAQVVELDDDAVRQEGAGARQGRAASEWLRGVAALRQADHAQALVAFETEAADAVAASSPQWAAVAYRAAAASARSVGRADQSNRLLRLAGKSYLEIAEAATTLPQGVFSAYREAARAFLEAGNLPLAQQCLTKALAVGETLGLMERA